MDYVVLDAALLRQGVFSLDGPRRKLLVVLAAGLIDALLRESERLRNDAQWSAEARAFLDRLPPGTPRTLVLRGSRDIFDAAEVDIRETGRRDPELARAASRVRPYALAADLVALKKLGWLPRAIGFLANRREEAGRRRGRLLATAVGSGTRYLVSDDAVVLNAARAVARQDPSGDLAALSFDEFRREVAQRGFDLDTITDRDLLPDALELLQRKPRGPGGARLP